MKSKKIIVIFFILTIQSSKCIQNDLVYQPKAYSSFAETKGKVLYPGDTILYGYLEGPYCIDSKPAKRTMILIEAPMIDARYFYMEQVSVNSYITDVTHFNYNIMLKYTVKKVLLSVSTYLSNYWLYNNEGAGLWEIGGTEPINRESPSQSFHVNIAPLNQDQIIENLKLPDFLGEVYSLNTIGSKVIYPGDVVKIENIITYQVSDSGTAYGPYEYLFFPYRDRMNVYQDPITDYIKENNWHKSKTHFYFVIKDTCNEEFSFDVMKWTILIGAFRGDQTYGYGRLDDIKPVSVKPLPDFFRLTNGNRDLRKALQKYLHGKDGCIANAQDADKRTPLMWAIFYGQEDVVKYFLSDPIVSVVGQDKDGRTALIYAAHSNNAQIAKLLLAKDSAYQALPLQDTDGMTMLHYAAWNNNLAMVQSILSTKSVKNFVNFTNTYGVTPLMYACAQGNKKLVQLLLDNKADYSLVDKNGCDCLFYACLSLNSDLVKYLYGYMLADNKVTAQKILNAKINDGTHLIYNILLEAQSDEECHDIVEFLIGQGLNPDSKCDVSKNNTLQLYLQSPVMNRGMYGSVLALACSKAKALSKTIQLLLEQGAVVTKEAITVAQKNNVYDIVKTYSENAGPSLYKALYSGNTKTALHIARQFDADIDFTHDIVNYSNSGWSVLFLLAAQARGAAMADYNSIAQALIERGANSNIIGPDQQGNPVTPLVWAVNNGNTQLQEILQTSKAVISQAVASTVTLDTALTGTLIPTIKSTQTQTSKLVTGGMVKVNGVAIAENIESYDSVEYLLG